MRKWPKVHSFLGTEVKYPGGKMHSLPLKYLWEDTLLELSVTTSTARMQGDGAHTTGPNKTNMRMCTHTTKEQRLYSAENGQREGILESLIFHEVFYTHNQWLLGILVVSNSYWGIYFFVIMSLSRWTASCLATTSSYSSCLFFFQ